MMIVFYGCLLFGCRINLRTKIHDCLRKGGEQDILHRMSARNSDLLNRGFRINEHEHPIDHNCRCTILNS